MITIDITEEDIKKAREIEKMHITTAKMYNKVDKFVSNDKDFIGGLGEAVFSRWLISKWIIAPVNLNHYVKGDGFDFIINHKIIDVKTAKLLCPIDEMIKNKWKSWKFLFPKQQINKKMDYCVHILLSPDMKVAYLMGFISKESLRKYPISYTYRNSIGDFIIPIQDLIPIDKLIEVIQNG